MMRSEKSRNLNIEIWRILFCIVIVLYHVGMVFGKNLLGVGYLCVEFYFILSGYGVYRAYQSVLRRLPANQSDDLPVIQSVKARTKALAEYAAKRFIRLYPLYFAAIAAMAAVRLITGESLISDLPELIRSCGAEFFMLQCSPLGNAVMVLTDWYVATLFWGSLLYMLLLLLGGRLTSLVICPAAAVLIYGYYARLIAKIDVIVSYYGFLRALAGIGLGIFLGAVIEALQKKRYEKNAAGSKPDKILLVSANLILCLITVYYQFGTRSLWDFAVIGLFFVSLFALLLTAGHIGGRWEKWIRILSGLTYPIYLFQLPILKLAEYLLGHFRYFPGW